MADPAPMKFNNGDTYSQIMVSEAAANCFLKQLGRSKIGQLDLNTERFNALFGFEEEWPLTTASIQEQLPIFMEKAGA